MALTDAQARRSKAGDRDYKLADSLGLHLFVRTTGSRTWRLKYRFGGKEKLLTIGPYPEVGLADARDQRDEARRLLRENVDPGLARKKARAATTISAENTFERVARRWHESQLERWSTVHAQNVIESLERHVFASLGTIPIRDIDATLVLETLRRVERRGAVETAHRLRQRMSAVFVHAISEGIGTGDPAAIVTKALKPMPKVIRQPSIVDRHEHLEDRINAVREVITAADESTADVTTKLASRLIALTVVRPAIIRGARWDEFEGIDWDDARAGPDLALWRVPAERMKLDKDKKSEKGMEHIVPLPWQAVETLRAARRLTGRGPLAFPSARHSHRPMSENAIGYLYNRVGYHSRHVPHGWRAAFSTIMNERAERGGRAGDRAVLDLMLAHVPKDKVESAYNRAAFMPRRRELAQEWADILLAGMGLANDLIDRGRD